VVAESPLPSHVALSGAFCGYTLRPYGNAGSMVYVFIVVWMRLGHTQYVKMRIGIGTQQGRPGGARFADHVRLRLSGARVACSDPGHQPRRSGRPGPAALTPVLRGFASAIARYDPDLGVYEMADGYRPDQ